MAEERFRRELGLIATTAIGIGTVVGSGIVKLPGTLAELVGPLQILAWIIGGILCALIGYTITHIARLFTETGGIYTYIKNTFDKKLAFCVTWVYWLASVMAIGALAVATADSIRLLFDIELSKALFISLSALVIILITVLNLVGVKVSGASQTILTFLKVSIWIVFIVFGLAILALNPSLLNNILNYPISGDLWQYLPKAIVILLWAYLGFETITFPSEEIKEPEKTIPKAIILTILLATIIYVLISTVSLAIMGVDQLAKYGISGVEMAARKMWGTVGGKIFSLLMITSFIAVMNGLMLAASRLFFSFARDGIVPEPLSRIHEKYKVPHISIIFQALVALFAVFGFEAVFSRMVEYLVYGYLLAYTFAILAALVAKAQGKISVKYIEAIAITALLVISWLISDWKPLLYTIAAFLTGYAIYEVSERTNRNPRAFTLTFLLSIIILAALAKFI